MEEKKGTLPPSKRKIERAREKGDFPYSREMVSAVVVVGELCVVVFAGQVVASKLMSWSAACFSSTQEGHAQFGIKILLGSVGLLGGAALVFALLAGVFQAGVRFAPKFDLNHVNVAKGISKIFSLERLLDLLILVAKVAALCWIGWWCCGPLIGSLRSFQGLDLHASFAAATPMVLRLAAFLVAATLGLGIFDWWLQRRRFNKRMRMTHEEMMNERKDQEGDPHLRAERRRRHRQLLVGVGLAAVRRATLVVTNPTHIAVALRYCAGEDDAPWVIASGREEFAARIKKEATQNGVPVLEQVLLARSLFKVEPGDEIPLNLYQAVAEVILAVQRKGNSR